MASDSAATSRSSMLLLRAQQAERTPWRAAFSTVRAARSAEMRFETAMRLFARDLPKS